MLHRLGEERESYGGRAIAFVLGVSSSSLLITRLSSTTTLIIRLFFSFQVILQVSGFSPPSVFQTVIGMELQPRQGNFGASSDQTAELRPGIEFEDAKKIIGTYVIKKQHVTKSGS